MEEIVAQFENPSVILQPEGHPWRYYKNWERYGKHQLRFSYRKNNLDSGDIIRQINDDYISFQVGYNETIYVPAYPEENYFRNLLMFPDWMVELPDDLNTNWYMTLCPKGLRTLVVACNGTTKCFSKNGNHLFEIETQLPGGNYFEKNGSCTLDCIYIKSMKKMYVIDVITWNNHIMADGTMEFRDYWLKARFSEAPELGGFNNRNQLIFTLLSKIPCQLTTMSDILMTYPIFPEVELDGFLFFHKESRYVAGQPPLVGWLYPNMIPKVLYPDMPIHEKYAAANTKNLIDLDSRENTLWAKCRDVKGAPAAAAEPMGDDAVAGPSSAWQPASDTASVETDLYPPDAFKFFDDEMEFDDVDNHEEFPDEDIEEMSSTTEHENVENETSGNGRRLF